MAEKQRHTTRQSDVQRFHGTCQDSTGKRRAFPVETTRNVSACLTTDRASAFMQQSNLQHLLAQAIKRQHTAQAARCSLKTKQMDLEGTQERTTARLSKAPPQQSTSASPVDHQGLVSVAIPPESETALYDANHFLKIKEVLNTPVWCNDEQQPLRLWSLFPSFTYDSDLSIVKAWATPGSIVISSVEQSHKTGLLVINSVISNLVGKPAGVMVVESKQNVDEVVMKMNTFVRDLALDLAFVKMGASLREWDDLADRPSNLERFKTGRLIPIFPYQDSAGKGFAELVHSSDSWDVHLMVDEADLTFATKLNSLQRSNLQSGYLPVKDKGTMTHVLNLRERELMRLLGKHDNASAEVEQGRLQQPLDAGGEYIGRPYENSRIFNCCFVTATAASVHQLHIDLHLPYRQMAVSSDRAGENGYGTLQDVVPANVFLDDQDLTPAAIKNLASEKIRNFILDFGRQCRQRDVTSGAFIRQYGSLQIYLTNKVHTPDVNAFLIGEACLGMLDEAIVLIKKGQAGEKDSGYWVTAKELKDNMDSKYPGFLHWQQRNISQTREQPFKSLSRAIDAIDEFFDGAAHRPLITLGHIIRGCSNRGSHRVLTHGVMHMPKGRDLSDVQQLVMRSGGKDVRVARQRNGWNPTFTLLSKEDTYKAVVPLYKVSCQLLNQAGTGRASDLHSRIQVDASARSCINTDRKIGKRDISRTGISFRRPSAPSRHELPLPSQNALRDSATLAHPPERRPVVDDEKSADVQSSSQLQVRVTVPVDVVTSESAAELRAELRTVEGSAAVVLSASESAPQVPPPENPTISATRQESVFDTRAVANGQLRAVMYALFLNASGNNDYISAPTIIRLLADRGLVIEHTSKGNAPKQIGNQLVTLRNVELAQSAAHQKYAARIGSLLISKMKSNMNGLERTGRGKTVAYRITAEFAEALKPLFLSPE